MGLQPYTEDDREYFFGREREQRVISSNLYAAPLTLLYGASGVGKTSILRAGVVPRLQSARRTAVVYFNRWQDPGFLGSLKLECLRTLEKNQGRPLEVDAGKPLHEFLAASLQAFKGALLILFDQFEEYFLYHPESGVDSRFESEFASAVNSGDAELGFVVALRDDWLSRLDRFQGRIPNLLGNTYRLEHLSAAAAEEAIRKPIEVYNRRHTSRMPISVEDDLVRAILGQVRAGQLSLSELTGTGKARAGDEGDRIETAFLQIVMSRLWHEEMKVDSRRLRLSTLDRLGGAKQIVQSRLESLLGQLSGDEQEMCARIFRYLVTPGGAKIAHETADLVAFAERPAQQVTPLLERLADPSTRLLRRISPPEGYEIFHDVLVPAILDWRTTYQKGRERAEAVERAAREAAEQEKEATRQRELTQVQALAKEQKRRAEEKAKAARRLRGLTAALAVMFLLAVAAAGIAGMQRQKAQASARLAEANARLAGERLQEVEKANQLAKQRLDRIVESMKLKQAVLSGEDVPPSYINHEIRFRVTAKEYPYKSRTGLPTYGFAMSPVESSIPGGFKSLAFVTYRMAHHTFPNWLLATGPDRNFTASFDGVGCLTRVVAVIEYADPDKPPTVATFNMCKELGRP